MRVLMSGGGTGGHVNPAIAIANTIREHEPDSEIAFVGTSRGIENKLVPAEGYKLYHIEIQGLRRSLSPENIRTAFLMLSSHHQAKQLLREFQPDIVIGTGGYACWPIVYAAAEVGIPTALHESNAVPGVAVRMLERHVDRIFVNFEETIASLKHPEKALRVGNPLRGGFEGLSREEARSRLGISGKYSSLLLSCGGSMGAERVNEEMLRVMRNYTAKHPEILHIHGTGSIEYEIAKGKFVEMGLEQYPNLELVEYIFDMPTKMAAADVVVSRAGAMTLSELAMLSKPCILIPSPNVTNNHQYKNAKALADRGAAVLIEEKDCVGSRVTDAVSMLLSDAARRRAMSEKINSFAIKNCNNFIYSELKKLVK